MSRSNTESNGSKNPAKRFFEWSGSTGEFKYYDKENKKNVIVPLPFKFIVLDTLTTIKGFNDAAGSGYWSNEVRNVKEDILVVRDKTGICAKGVYDEVIRHRATIGCKFSQSVYIAYFEGKVLTLGNIQMVGSAVGSWFDFRKETDVFKCAIVVNTALAAKKGKTDYFMPVFSPFAISEKTELEAIALDKELQAYLLDYLKAPVDVEPKAETGESKEGKIKTG